MIDEKKIIRNDNKNEKKMTLNQSNQHPKAEKKQIKNRSDETNKKKQ